MCVSIYMCVYIYIYIYVYIYIHIYWASKSHYAERRIVKHQTNMLHTNDTRTLHISNSVPQLTAVCCGQLAPPHKASPCTQFPNQNSVSLLLLPSNFSHSTHLSLAYDKHVSVSIQPRDHLLLFGRTACCHYWYNIKNEEIFNSIISIKIYLLYRRNFT